MGARNQISTLVRMYDNICHYCGRQCVRNGGKLAPTREHVVPKAFGGENTIKNFVLACAGCNHERGTMLFFCECEHCTALINDALSNPRQVNLILSGMLAHNKPRISKISEYTAHPGRWKVRIGHHVRVFHTFEQALEFTFTETMVKDQNYV